MHPELTHMINAQRNREMRDQAAGRRAGQARGAAEADARSQARPGSGRHSRQPHRRFTDTDGSRIGLVSR
jgi:hypothetical protein